MVTAGFTVHLPEGEMNKLNEMKMANPNLSRNALVKLAINSYSLGPQTDQDGIKRHVNALHKQLNPEWKRKKSLPYHFDDEYMDVLNYTSYHGKDSQ